MAKPVTFSAKPKKTKGSGGNTDFNFGFNSLSKSAAKKYNHSIGKRGSKAGGS